MPRGGKRAGAGRKFGTKEKQTISKEAARELARQIIMRDLEPMIRAQVSHAKGINHMMLRGKDGKFERATSADQILAALNSEDENSYYIFTKDPSVQAFTDLMNRALDKAAEQRQELDVTVHGDDLLAKVQAARQRLVKAKAEK